MKKYCGTCDYAHFDQTHGIVCTNSDSESVAKNVEYRHCCEKYTGNGERWQRKERVKNG